MATSPHLNRRLTETLDAAAAEELVSRLEHSDALRADVSEFRHEMQLGFAGIDAQFAAIDTRFEALEQKFDQTIDALHQKLDLKVDGLRLERITPEKTDRADVSSAHHRHDEA